MFGAGAVGGNLAARLGACGHEVSVVARGAHLAAIQEHGLRVLLPDGASIEARVRASADPAALGEQDAVIVAAKAIPAAMPALAEGLRSLLGPDTPAVFAQNGIPWWYARDLPEGATAPDLRFLDPGGALAAAVGGRAVGCVVYSANVVKAPGVVRQAPMDVHRWVLGRPIGGRTPALDALAAAIVRAGVEAPVVPDIRHALWTKLLNNVAQNPICCLLGAPLSILGDDPSLLQLAKALIRETLAACAAHGVRLDIDPETRFGARNLSSPHRPSMLQDMDAGRPVEIAAILEAPRRFARAAGVPTPALDACTALLSRKAAAMGLYAPLPP